jgi:uncharacterized integral membrane protein (TIGR00698 family)
VSPDPTPATTDPAVSATEPAPRAGLRALWPGVALALSAAALASVVNVLAPAVSPLIVAILLGMLVANLVRLPGVTTAGIDFSAKKLLRAGIVLLGLRLVLADIVGLGAPMLAVIVVIVAGGIVGTFWLGRLLRVPSRLSLLIACGFSICGAAAVAGAAGVLDPDDEAEEDTITAVALVVIFGTLMIALLPVAANLLGLSAETAGLWAGGSVHEIAQVIAVGGILGGGAMTLAVMVKLARVLLLAPVVAVLSLRQRASLAAQSEPRSRSKLPPIVPAFVLGFLAMVLLRSFVPIPEGVLTVTNVLQTGLLAAAMFGLGCGVRIRNLAKVGLRPFALAALATLLVAGIAYAGVLLVGPTGG